ncbi:MAG: hypothetical protein M1839_003995 [Geoglossum umbratile]|nr:MAG: hypothetical protein M1839_003995 [Geoglossum umbratile]
MGSAISVQRQGSLEALKQKFKEVAQIARLLKENSVAESLEALSELSDRSVDPTVLNVRKDLIKASTPQLRQDPAPRDGLSEHFQQFGLNKEHIERLIPLAQAWERQKLV